MHSLFIGLFWSQVLIVIGLCDLLVTACKKTEDPKFSVRRWQDIRYSEKRMDNALYIP